MTCGLSAIHIDWAVEAVAGLVRLGGHRRRRLFEVQFGEDAARVDRVRIVRFQVEHNVLRIGFDHIRSAVSVRRTVERVQEALDPMVRIKDFDFVDCARLRTGLQDFQDYAGHADVFFV